MDLVSRLIASSCSENCLMGKAAKEIVRLRKIEAAARKIASHTYWQGNDFYDAMCELQQVIGEDTE